MAADGGLGGVMGVLGKAAAWVLFAAGCAAAFVLFTEYGEPLVSEPRLRAIAWCILVFCAAGLVAKFFAPAWDRLQREWDIAHERKLKSRDEAEKRTAAIAYMGRLDINEKHWLAQYLVQGSRAPIHPGHSNVPRPLVRHGIIEGIGGFTSRPSYELTDWAWDALSENPGLVGLEVQKGEDLAAAQSRWAKELEQVLRRR